MATTAFGAVGSATTIYTSAQADAQFPAYSTSTFTPTMTLVGGAGNVVPDYVTNTGLYTVIANRCFIDIYLTGDGGNEGAGTGVINIALPFAANASQLSGAVFAGQLTNGAAVNYMYASIAAAASVITFTRSGASVVATATVPGTAQNNLTRRIRLRFWYYV